MQEFKTSKIKPSQKERADTSNWWNQRAMTILWKVYFLNLLAFTLHENFKKANKKIFLKIFIEIQKIYFEIKWELINSEKQIIYLITFLKILDIS